MSGVNDTISIVTFLINNKEPKKLIDISKSLNISGSTAYRILCSLKRFEWVVQDELTKKYKIGPYLLELAFSLISQLDLKSVSHSFLELLNKKVNESVMLSARVGLERIYIEQIKSSHELQHIVELGKRMPLWIGAPGKAILAYMKEKEIEMVIEKLKISNIRFFASGEAINIDKLCEELVQIRKEGFSTSSGERVPGTNAVAAPIFDSKSTVVGAISIGGPLPRFTLEIAKSYGHLVREIADKISYQLGYFSPD